MIYYNHLSSNCLSEFRGAGYMETQVWPLNFVSMFLHTLMPVFVSQLM